MWRDEGGGDPLRSRAEDCDEEGDECTRQKALFVGHGAVEGDAAFVTQIKDHHNDRRNRKQVGEHRVQVDVRSVQAGDPLESHPHKGHGGEYERPFEFGLKTFHSLCGITFPGIFYGFHRSMAEFRYACRCTKTRGPMHPAPHTSAQIRFRRGIRRSRADFGSAHTHTSNTLFPLPLRFSSVLCLQFLDRPYAF